MRRLLSGGLLAAALFSLSGFSLDRTIVPKEEILSGGPPKDGIPAILAPKFIAAEEVQFLDPDDEVIGVRIGERARAYPIKILNWHEAVNDTVHGKPIAVTF